MQKKKSGFLLASAILSSLYLILLIYYCNNFDYSSVSSFSELIGTKIGLTILKPHMYMTGLAIIFNWIGWSMNIKWSALTGGILYCVAVVLMPLYVLNLTLQIIFSFIGFAKLNNIIQYNLQIEQQSSEQLNIEQSSSDNSNIV